MPQAYTVSLAVKMCFTAMSAGRHTLHDACREIVRDEEACQDTQGDSHNVGIAFKCTQKGFNPGHWGVTVQQVIKIPKKRPKYGHRNDDDRQYPEGRVFTQLVPFRFNEIVHIVHLQSGLRNSFPNLRPSA